MADHPTVELRPDDTPPSGHKGRPAMDEIVATGANIHIERMDDNIVWGSIDAGGKRIVMTFRAKGGKLLFSAEEE